MRKIGIRVDRNQLMEAEQKKAREARIKKMVNRVCREFLKNLCGTADVKKGAELKKAFIVKRNKKGVPCFYVSREVSRI